jgi:alpha-glucosidase
VKLDFLDAAHRYRAHIYRDGTNADWRTHPFAIAIERREVRRGDTLQLKLAPGGGQAIRFQLVPGEKKG